MVRFEAVTKRFGAFTAVDQVSLDIHEGEFFALLGPSGCGKTTLLRMLAGFEQPSEGRVLLDGEDITAVPPHRRPVNMMFQSYALFPHMTVAWNIAFGLRQEGMARDAIAARVEEMLALVRLQGFGHRRPQQLSGGQRQRVALARALVKRPRVFLLDEPLAALDRKLREDTRFELRELQAKLGLTFVIVTHDQDEAMSLAGRIAVMNAGRLVQVAPPPEIYERPRSRWIADFIGDINLVEGRVVANGAEAAIETKEGIRVRLPPATEAAIGATVWLALRPEKIALHLDQPAASNANMLTGEIREVAYLGGSSLYKIAAGDRIMKVSAPSRAAQPLVSGRKVWLSWPADAGVVLTQ